jgi:hypothetical protein
MSPGPCWNDAYAISSPLGDHDGESSPVTPSVATAAGCVDPPSRRAHVASEIELSLLIAV